MSQVQNSVTTLPEDLVPVLGHIEIQMLCDVWQVVHVSEGQWYFDLNGTPVSSGIPCQPMDGPVAMYPCTVLSWQHLPALPSL